MRLPASHIKYLYLVENFVARHLMLIECTEHTSACHVPLEQKNQLSVFKYVPSKEQWNVPS